MLSTTRGWRRTASAYEGAAPGGRCALCMSVVSPRNSTTWSPDRGAYAERIEVHAR
jgi:hypothetical protein